LPIESGRVGQKRPREVPELRELGCLLVGVWLRRPPWPQPAARLQHPGLEASEVRSDGDCAVGIPVEVPQAGVGGQRATPRYFRAAVTRALHDRGADAPAQVKPGRGIARVLHACQYSRARCLLRHRRDLVGVIGKEVGEDGRGCAGDRGVLRRIRRVVRSRNDRVERRIDNAGAASHIGVLGVPGRNRRVVDRDVY
jgi:hypothetical protein